MKLQSQFVNSFSFRISGSVQIQAKERGMRTVRFSFPEVRNRKQTESGLVKERGMRTVADSTHRDEDSK